MKKLLVLMAGGVGYVLGTKAGRERYEQLRGTFNKVKDDPRVQQKAHQAADFAKEQAPVVKDKVAAVADTATTKVKEKTGGSSDAPVEQLNPDRIRITDESGPQGTLP